MATGPTQTELEYRRLLAEHAREGGTLKAFAEAHGVPPQRLSWWKHAIKQRDRRRAAAATLPATRSAPAELLNDPVEPSTQFLPVRLVEASMAPPDATSAALVEPTCLGYELVFGGRRLRLPRDFDPVRAGALVRAVEASVFGRLVWYRRRGAPGGPLPLGAPRPLLWFLRRSRGDGRSLVV